MKMTKKILFGAAALCAAVLFSGCNEIGDIDWKTGTSGDGTRTYSVNQTNETDKIIRGAKKVGIANRAGGTCKVTLKDQTTNSKDGNVGFITGLSENDNGTISFLSVAIQNNSGTLRYYASMFFNIDPNNLSADNFGASVTKTAYDEDETEPYEIEIKGWTNLFAASTLLGTDDTSIEMAIDVSTTDAGAYNVEIWKEGTWTEQTAAATLDLNDGESAVASFGVTTAQNGNTDASKGGLYVYANIQPSKTLNARWDIYNVTFKQTTSLAALSDEADYSTGDIIWE